MRYLERSRKQLETNNITDAKVIDIIDCYQPEQVFLKRFEWSQLNEFLARNYQLTKQEREFRLYTNGLKSTKSYKIK